MTARNDATPSRYIRSEAMRQAVLYLVHANPGISGSEIIKHVGGDIEALPEAAFKASGTMVRTVIVTIPA
jgi:hypothetical protein